MHAFMRIFEAVKKKQDQNLNLSKVEIRLS